MAFSVDRPSTGSGKNVIVSMILRDKMMWWSNLIRCPSCLGHLSDLQCSNGHSFIEVDGTPSLVPDDLEVDVHFKFSSHRSLITHDELLLILEDPATKGGEGLPYHMDRAHAQALAALPQGTRVLEIGCGGGQSRPWFEQRGMKYIGTDVSKTRVWEELRKFGGADILCDAHFLPFENDSFDVVYSAAVFEHLACPIRAVQEIRRVLKPGGLMLSNASFLEPWHDHSYFHLSPLGVVELLTAGGMTPLKVWPSRDYSGYQAVPNMRAARWSPSRLFGQIMHRTQKVEDLGRKIARRVSGRPAKPLILEQAISAGAIDWIAKNGK